MKEEDEGLYKRLIAVLNHLGCDKNTSLFAKSLGVNSQNISNIYNRQTIPKLNLLSKIATNYPDKINYIWLLTGKGQMEIAPPSWASLNLKDVVGEEAVGYHNQIESLKKLAAKDEKINELQDEVKQLQRQIISMLEEKLK